MFAMTKILNVCNLRKSYTSGSKKLIVLDSISFEVHSGATFSIVGPSGSGKTTLLGLCAGLDKLDEGTVDLCGTQLNTLNEDCYNWQWYCRHHLCSCCPRQR